VWNGSSLVGKYSRSPVVTLLSAAIILAFSAVEVVDYRMVDIDASIVVDKSRGEKLTLNLNVTFLMDIGQPHPNTHHGA